MRKSTIVLFISAALMSGQAGHAQNDEAKTENDDKFYVDLGYNRLGSDIPDFGNAESDPEFGALGGQLGYQLSELWSIEGQALIGVENDKSIYRTSTELTSTTTDVKRDLSYLVGLYAKGNVPITQKLSAFGRLGLAHAEFDTSFQTTLTNLTTDEVTVSSDDRTFSDTGVAMGLGLTYDVTDRLYVRSDYTRVDLLDSEFDSASVGIGLRF